MSIPARVKVCPQCQQPAPIEAQWCASCKHQFRTKFQTTPERTQLLEPSQMPVLPEPLSPLSILPPDVPPVYYPPPAGYVQQPYGQQPYIQQPYGQQPVYLPATPMPMPGFVQRIAGTHSVGIAILLAVLLTSAGQFYNGQVAKGILLLLGAIFGGLCTFGILTGVFWLIGLIDALCIANKLNAGQPVRDWEFF